MPGTIKLKRGLSANIAAAVLVQAEPAFCTDNGKLYIFDGTNKILINPDNALTASKLLATKNFSVTGDVTAPTVPFDGSADVALNVSLPAVGTPGVQAPKVTTDAKGRVISSAALVAGDIPTLTLSKISDAGTVAGLNTGITAGNVPVLDVGGKLNTAVLPSLAIVDTYPVANQAAMLALTCDVGDIAIRADGAGTFILHALPASTIGNWLLMNAPTDVVTSVNTRTGAIVLTATDVGLANVTNESKATMFTAPTFTGVSAAPTAAVNTNTTQLATTAFVIGQAATVAPVMDGVAAVGTSTTFARQDHVHASDTVKANLASPTFTGVPAAPTAVVDTSTTQLATTAYVVGQAYAKLASPALSGTPTAPTAISTTNTTQIATTAFVKSLAYMDGNSTIDGGTF